VTRPLPDAVKALVVVLLWVALGSVALGHTAVIPAPGVARSSSPVTAAAGPVVAGALSRDQVGQLATDAGFTGYSRLLAVAVALAESGGRPGARHVNDDGSVDRGLWQVNDLAHADVDDRCAFDAACSAHAAFAISDHGANWTPWTTYSSGAYLAFMPGGAA
jgi:hypothetical protein